MFLNDEPSLLGPTIVPRVRMNKARSRILWNVVSLSSGDDRRSAQFNDSLDPMSTTCCGDRLGYHSDIYI